MDHADFENALGRPGWFEVEEQGFDGLQEATVGIEVAVMKPSDLG
jgi:hypothetical protein